jgi:hypothetical protein
VETTRNYQYYQEIDCLEVKGLKMIIPEEQRFYRWKVTYYDSFHLADQWNFSMINLGRVSFGAALIAAPKSLNVSLDVTSFELEHWTSAFASWDIGRHVLQVGTLDVMFFELVHLNWILDQKKLCDHFLIVVAK